MSVRQALIIGVGILISGVIAAIAGTALDLGGVAAFVVGILIGGSGTLLSLRIARWP